MERNELVIQLQKLQEQENEIRKQLDVFSYEERISEVKQFV